MSQAQGPSDSEWFSRFIQGYKSRVGQRKKQDAAISIGIMVALQNLFEEEWRTESDRQGSGESAFDSQLLKEIAETATFFLFCFCCSLRGFEAPKIVLDDIRNQIQLEKKDGIPAHVGVPLFGRFKARSNSEVRILIFTVAETASGLKPGLWISRLVRMLDVRGKRTGWLFQDEVGNQKKMSAFEDEFYEKLFELKDQDDDRRLFEPGVDIPADFHLARSFRRGATTRATNAGVSDADIDWINRWNTGGSETISGPMRVTYADRKQMLKTFLRFSSAL